MEVKEAIKTIKDYISCANQFSDLAIDDDNVIEFNSIIELLQQGEKYRHMWKELKEKFRILHKDYETGEEYYTGVINKSDIKELEQKYFPKEKNDTISK